MIDLKEIAYRMQVSGVKMSGENITGVASSVPAVSECAEIELQEYVAHVRALAELLFKYKQMITKDCKSIFDSIETLKEADQKAALEIIKNVAKNAVDAAQNTTKSS